MNDNKIIFKDHEIFKSCKIEDHSKKLKLLLQDCWKLKTIITKNTSTC